MKKIAVIGGGPAGIFAAYSASNLDAQVDLYDHNEKIGKKLFITGKGRCNVTNASDIEDYFSKIPRNNKFLYSALYTFDNTALMSLLEENGCNLKVERGNRVFPASDKSSDIIKTFLNLLKKNKVNIYLNKNLDDLIINNNVCEGIIIDNQKIYYDDVILCAGGISYPQTGSDGSVFKILKKYGHTITDLDAALVGLKTNESWPREVTGLTLKNVSIKLYNGSKLIFTDLGECLFTHSGISGPIVLSASSYIEKPYNDYKIIIDLKPGLSEEKLDLRILKDFQANINKNFQNSLGELLPKNLIPVIIELSGISPQQKVNSITKEERSNLVHCIKNLEFTIKEPNSIEGAIVTRGGVNTKEINPQNMESKIIKNLYFAGEMIDVNALTGGYNIQIACSTGFLAGSSAVYDE